MSNARCSPLEVGAHPVPLCVARGVRSYILDVGVLVWGARLPLAASEAGQITVERQSLDGIDGGGACPAAPWASCFFSRSDAELGPRMSIRLNASELFDFLLAAFNAADKAMSRSG